MEKNQQQNHLNNPVVVILLIALIGLGGYVIFSKNQNNSQPVQNNQNYQPVVDNSEKPQSEQPTQDNTVKQANSTVDIVKEWRKSTAYIECDWYYSNGNVIQSVSGSGLLATFNSIPTIVTNKHVVYSSTYGYTNRCSIKFPDDDGAYIYSNNISWFPNYGTLTTDSNGGDVAYISGMHWVHTYHADNSSSASDQGAVPPSISLNSRSRNNSFVCSNAENTGDSVLILGYPIYGSQIDPFGSQTEPTVTEGIISGLDGIYYTTSAKIDHGNSGGLAIDEANDCYFGIPTWNESGSFESLGRILPASTFLH